MTVSTPKAIIGPIAVSVAFVMELTLVPLLLPEIQNEFGLTLSQMAWVFNSYGIAVAVGVLIGGWLGDVGNANRIFGIGVLFFATGSMLVAFAASYEALTAARALQGLGGGIFSPLIPILLTRASPRQPGKVLIVWGSVAGYVASAAPFFYSSVLNGHRWNLAFIILALISLVALAIVLVSRPPDTQTPSAPAVPRYTRLLRAPELWIVFGYVFCTYGAITYYLFRLPLWLAQQEVQVVSIGLNLSILWLSFSIVSTLLRNWVDEPHLKGIMLAAPLFVAAGFLLAYLCNSAVCLIVASALLGTGLACSNAPSTQLVLKFAPRGMSAISASLDITFARLGGVMTVAFLAQTLFGASVLVMIAMCLAALLFAVAATRRLDNFEQVTANVAVTTADGQVHQEA